MTVHDEAKIGPQSMSPEVVWRNPLPHVRACLRAREANNPYCRWAEQGSKIRARRSNWDIKNNWTEWEASKTIAPLIHLETGTLEFALFD